MRESFERGHGSHIRQKPLTPKFAIAPSTCAHYKITSNPKLADGFKKWWSK